MQDTNISARSATIFTNTGVVRTLGTACVTLLFLIANHWLLNSTRSYDRAVYVRDALIINSTLLVAIHVIRMWILRPLQRIIYHLHQVHITFTQGQPHRTTSLFGIGEIANEVARFATLALKYYRRHQQLAHELNEAQRIIAQFALHQDALLDSTSREIGTQYRSVLAYANYLEEQIIRNKIDPMLRYDFDEVCESSFNLKLIAGALAMLTVESPPHVTAVPIAGVMQRTMLALAPALDRRTMKLTTAEVDLNVEAFGDPGYISHILWMMLLGMIRYAASESTLRIRCFHNHDETRAMMSIVVTELAPEQLSEEERRNHLARHLHPVTPHMFAETIGIHGNIQLAHLLTERMGGSITIVPLTAASCEISMELPAAHEVVQ